MPLLQWSTSSLDLVDWKWLECIFAMSTSENPKADQDVNLNFVYSQPGKRRLGGESMGWRAALDVFHGHKIVCGKIALPVTAAERVEDGSG